MNVLGSWAFDSVSALCDLGMGGGARADVLRHAQSSLDTTLTPNPHTHSLILKARKRDRESKRVCSDM